MRLEQAILQAFKEEKEGSFLYHLSPDFPAFNGHFEGNPLLPAVCQMGLCADALSRQTGKPQEIAAIGRSKFMRPIQPGVDLLVTLTVRADGRLFAELTHPQTQQKFSQIIFSAREKGSAK